MPFMNIKTSVKVTREKEKIIKTRLITAMNDLSDNMRELVLNVEDEFPLNMKNDKTQYIAFIEVKLYGKANS
ncbi:MAG: hypothetical protein K0R90_760, partial [Oscillospiraceae bacterium]|nr:hypothetical protein [Oscillospiraceae bacterium]